MRKTAIQALDRLDPDPLAGRAERHGFEYYRHGTRSLYAAPDSKTGRVQGKTTARQTSRDFFAFLKEVWSLCSPRQQIHIIIILDNLTKLQPFELSSSSTRESVSLDAYLLLLARQVEI